MFVLLEDAPAHIHHGEVWRAGRRPAPRWAVTEGKNGTPASISRGLANITNEYANRGKECAFCLPRFLLQCPNGFTKMSLCERKWWVSRWSAAVNLLYMNICPFSMCILKDDFESEDYLHILCSYRQSEDLLLPIYASYKWSFALRGAWGIKNGGTSLNSLLNAPRHCARNDGVKPWKEVLLCF